MKKKNFQFIEAASNKLQIILPKEKEKEKFQFNKAGRNSAAKELSETRDRQPL